MHVHWGIGIRTRRTLVPSCRNKRHSPHMHTYIAYRSYVVIASQLAICTYAQIILQSSCSQNNNSLVRVHAVLSAETRLDRRLLVLLDGIDCRIDGHNRCHNCHRAERFHCTLHAGHIHTYNRHTYVHTDTHSLNSLRYEIGLTVDLQFRFVAVRSLCSLAHQTCITNVFCYIYACMAEFTVHALKFIHAAICMACLRYACIYRVYLHNLQQLLLSRRACATYVMTHIFRHFRSVLECNVCRTLTSDKIHP